MGKEENRWNERRVTHSFKVCERTQVIVVIICVCIFVLCFISAVFFMGYKVSKQEASAEIRLQELKTEEARILIKHGYIRINVKDGYAWVMKK